MTDIDINGVFDRICEEKGLKSDTALADFLGVSKSAINQSRAKGTANLWTILEKCAGMDLNWLFRGTRSAPTMDTDAALAVLLDRGYSVRLEKREEG